MGSDGCCLTPWTKFSTQLMHKIVAHGQSRNSRKGTGCYMEYFSQREIFFEKAGGAADSWKLQEMAAGG